MARRHYWQFLVTDEGNPIENAEITIYIAGTNDPANVYLDEFGGNATASSPQTHTSRKGYFEFWIADTTEPNGYFFDQKFKIGWKAPGVSAGYIDYIDVFSTSVAEVDVTSTDPLKNKVVSNLLAKGWEDHRFEEIGIGGVVSIHGMTAVNEIEFDETNTNNTRRNRLISNIMGNNWESHANTYYDPASDSFRFHLDTGDYDVNDPSVGAPGNPHGIDVVDVTSTDDERNKLISNEMGRRWWSHVTDPNVDDHHIYSLVNGGRDYTAPVGYFSSSITFSSISDTDFVTKGMLIGWSYTETISSSDWTHNTDGSYGYVVQHNLNTDFPNVILWETTHSPVTGIVVQPISITRISVNSIEIRVSDNIEHFVRISQ
jgi:hypothetical protein